MPRPARLDIVRYFRIDQRNEFLHKGRFRKGISIVIVCGSPAVGKHIDHRPNVAGLNPGVDQARHVDIGRIKHPRLVAEPSMGENRRQDSAGPGWQDLHNQAASKARTPHPHP